MSDQPILQPGAVALVTGASRGIGRAVVESLWARGLRVICLARSAEALEDLVAAKPDQGLALPLDISDPTAIAKALADLPTEWQTIDVLVANAGSDVGGRRPFDEGDLADWAGTIAINVTGVIAACHAVIPGMLARGRGHIVTIGSVAGLSTYPGGSIYAASKHAVRAFTDGLRKDYGQSPLRITEVLPGLVRTGFATARHKGDETQGQAFYDSYPAALAPEDIAAATLFALEQPSSVNINQIVVTPTGNKS